MPRDEIRGFSLIREDYPPAIVINSKDSPNGRIFTLFHEFGHSLLNESGICIPEEIEFRDKKINETEKYCNEFAGTFLVPTEYLNRLIAGLQHSDTFELIDHLSREFTVSKFVILRRLYSIRKIDYNSYRDIYHKLRERIKTFRGSGGDYYRNKIAERGKNWLVLLLKPNQGGLSQRAGHWIYLEYRPKLKRLSKIKGFQINKSKIYYELVKNLALKTT